MEVPSDPGNQDLLDFLLEESGDLGAALDEALEASLDWELPPSEVGRVSEWGRSGAGGVPEAAGGDRSRPVNLNPVQVLSDWEGEDFLSSLLSSPESLNVLSSSNPCPVHHDHTYSVPHEHISIDLGEFEVRRVLGQERTHGPGYSYFPFCRQQELWKRGGPDDCTARGGASGTGT